VLAIAAPGCGGERAQPPPAAPAARAAAAVRIVAIPELATLSYACDRPARTFVTQIAVPKGGATVRVTRLGPTRGSPRRLQPGERMRTPPAAARTERWELRSVTEPETRTARVTIAYESRPETRDCVVEVLRLQVRTRSHAP
jgi:hypothetical protein